MPYKLLREVEGGKVVGLRLGVEEVDAYLDFIRDRCRPHTWLSIGYDLQIFLNEVSKSVMEITPKDILAFTRRQRETLPFARLKASAQAQKDQGFASPDLGLSPRTIKRRLASISGLYEFLRIRGDLTRINPVPRGIPTRGSPFWPSTIRRGPGTGTMPLVRTPRTLPQPLDGEEINKFLDSLRTLRDKAIILIMLMGALRKSEVLGLNLEDIDFGQSTLMVREGKGGHHRQIPVAGTALEATLRYLNEERPSSSSNRVFLVLKGPRRGQPMSRAALDMIVQYHRLQAGTPGLQCHRLRHTCLTSLRQAGMSIEALQELAGHQNINSTRVYLHLCAKELLKEYQQVSATFFPPQDTEVKDG